MHGFDPIKEIPGGVYLTGFFSNYPTQQTMTEIFAFLSGHQLTPDVGAVNPFEGISQALFDMDHHRVNGKIVVRACKRAARSSMGSWTGPFRRVFNRSQLQTRSGFPAWFFLYVQV